MKIPKVVGKIVYLVGYPFIYWIVGGSTRAYAVIRVGNRVLLTKNWLGLQRDWRLPGGGLKPGEDPKTAVAREVSEEIGLGIDPQKLLPVTKKAYKSRHGYYYHLFEITLDAEPPLNIRENEIVQAEFIEKELLKRLRLSEATLAVQKELGWS